MTRSLTRREFLLYGSAMAAGAVLGPTSAGFPGRLFGEERGEFESRAILDEGLNWVTPASAEKVCERIARAGFNVFIPCVWHGRGAIWPSKLAPWDSHNIRAQGFDPLGHLLHTAERYRLEIHPWITVALRQRDFFPEFYDEGTPAGHFDVHRRAFREFISSLVLEVARNYPVHGINLDFVYAGGICSSPSCAEDYRRKTGRNLFLDRQLRRAPGLAPNELIAWQEAAVGDIVRRISTGARAINPRLILSMSGQSGNPQLRLQGDDSGTWADEGLLDVVYNMHYEPAPDFEAIKAIQATMKRPEAMVVGIGNYEEATAGSPVRSREPKRIAELTRAARSIQQGNGVCVYLYSMLSDAQIELLRNSVFSRPARPRWVRATAAS